MDFSELDTAPAANAGIILHLVHPGTGEPLFHGEGEQKVPITMTLLGIDSPDYIRVQQSIADRRLQDLTSRKKGPKITSTQLESDTVEQYVTIVKSWSGIAVKGKLLPCSTEEKRAFFSNTGWRWVRDQIDEVIGDRSRYLGKS